MKLSDVGWLVTLGALGCAITAPTVPAQAYEAKEVQPFVICSAEMRSNELLAENIPLVPASGATVPAGTTVAFTGESNHALTFGLASSSALLSSSDIDSGMGSQSGAFYKFISIKAAAEPQTIYWTASFTLTPKDCEGPSTFTTPVRTLTVLPSPTEAATKKKSEEEAAVTGSVSLDGSTITVQSSGGVAAKLTCTGMATCGGKLTLTVKMKGKGKHRRSRTTTIGTATFSILSGKTTTIMLKLNARGHALLRADHGRLTSNVTIVKSSPGPSQTHTETVSLVQQKAHRKA